MSTIWNESQWVSKNISHLAKFTIEINIDGLGRSTVLCALPATLVHLFIFQNDVALIKYHFVRKYLENQFKAFRKKVQVFLDGMTQPHVTWEPIARTAYTPFSVLFAVQPVFFFWFLFDSLVVQVLLNQKIWLHLAIGINVVRLMVFRDAHHHKISSFVSFDGIRHVIWILLNNRGTNYTNICSLRWWVFWKGLTD